MKAAQGINSSQLRLVRSVERVRAQFDTGKTQSLRWRQRQLTGLLRFCFEQRRPLLRALRSDLGTPAGEAFAADVASVAMEVASLKWALRSLIRAERVPTRPEEGEKSWRQ